MEQQNTSSAETHQTVYLSGTFLPRSRALVSAFDRGFLYGDGFFETTRVFKGEPMAIRRHLKRLTRSCEAAEWNRIPASGELYDAAYKLIKYNKVKDGYLRITVSRGLHEGGLAAPGDQAPTVLIEARSMILPPLNATPPFTIVRSPYKKNEYGPAAGLKSLSYQENLLALAEARRMGADEVYFLNTGGFLSEGAISNLFWIKNKELFTPSEECGILPGITREILLEASASQGIICNIGAYPEKDLFGADEVFCTNSLRGVIPVQRVIASDQTKEPAGHTTTRLLADLYASITKITTPHIS